MNDIKEAAKYIKEYMKNNPGIKDLAPMYEAYPKDGRKYISQALIGIEPWKHMSYIPALAFDDCKDITSIVLPSTVTDIKGYAFYHCHNLKSITIPDSVASIGNSAFCGCDNLENIDIPDSVKKIGTYTFFGCTNLRKVTLPKKLISIRDSTFYECKSLIDIDIPKGVATIEDSAFRMCSNLSKITIPKSVMIVGKYAFSECRSLKEVIIENCNIKLEDSSFWRIKDLYVRFNGTRDQFITARDGTHSWRDNAFRDAEGKVEFKDGTVKRIGWI